MAIVTPEESLDRLRRVLAAGPVPGLISVYAFGSVPEGRSHGQSDLDIGVLFDRGVFPDDTSRFQAQMELRRHLSPSAVGREVDIVVLNDASPVFGRRIVRGERVYCAEPAKDHAFRRDVQLRAADLEPFLRKMRRVMLDRLTQ